MKPDPRETSYPDPGPEQGPAPNEATPEAATRLGVRAARPAVPEGKPVPMPIQEISYWTPRAILKAIARLIGR